jgi:hypothetical protein
MSQPTDTKVKSKRRRRSERNAALFDDDTVEFIQAIDAYRRRYDKSFPSWSEVLSLLKSLGYRKVAEPVESMESLGVTVAESLPGEDPDRS